MAGYLFSHFIGEEKDGEQIYFAVSRDGLHWKDLNAGMPVLYSHIGTCGVRDREKLLAFLDDVIKNVGEDELRRYRESVRHL